MNCVFWFSLQFFSNFFHAGRIKRDITTNIPISSCNCLPFCPISTKLEFYRQILIKESIVQNLTKSRPLGAEFYLANRWAGMTKLVVDFCNFANSCMPLCNFYRCSGWHWQWRTQFMKYKCKTKVLSKQESSSAFGNLKEIRLVSKLLGRNKQKGLESNHVTSCLEGSNE